MKERRVGSLGWGKFFRSWLCFDESYPPSFRDGPKDQTSDAQLRIGESRDSGFIAARCPGMTKKELADVELRPVRIEPLFQALPAIRLIVLQRCGLRRMRGDALRVARLEHEGHGARQLDRLQVAVAGMVEGLAIGAMRQHHVMQADAAGDKNFRARRIE